MASSSDPMAAQRGARTPGHPPARTPTGAAGMAAGPRDTMPSGKGRGLLQPPPPPAVTRPRFMASTLAAAPPPVFHESNAEALSLRARTKGLLTTSVVPGILSSSTGRPDVYSMNRRAPELVVTPYTAAHGFRERRATGLQDEHCTALPRSAQMLSTVAEFLTRATRRFRGASMRTIQLRTRGRGCRICHFQ